MSSTCACCTWRPRPASGGVEATLRARLDAGDPCDYAGVQAQVRPAVPTIPVVHVPRPNLAQYDALLSAGLLG